LRMPISRSSQSLVPERHDTPSAIRWYFCWYSDGVATHSGKITGEETAFGCPS
jgi:hypothetical protein